MHNEAAATAVKPITLPVEGLTLARLLQKAKGKDVVFLTKKGLPRFALMHADEGDQEVYALRNNAEFMAYLTDCKKRAREQPRKSMEEIQVHFGIPNGPVGRPKKSVSRK